MAWGTVNVQSTGGMRKQYDPVFANNSWADIVEACHNGEVPDTWVVGDSKTMEMADITKPYTLREYTVDIIGKNHDTYSDGTGTAPLTFQLHDFPNSREKMNDAKDTTCKWEDCTMRTSTLIDMFYHLQTEVRAGIRSVDKLTAGMHTTTLTTLSEKLFLLSEFEVFGSNDYAQVAEGTQYEYYANGGSKIKYAQGVTSGCVWWLRTVPNNNAYFMAVASSGGRSGGSSETANFVSFAFCF